MVLIELDDPEENGSNPPGALGSAETPGIVKAESPDGFETASDGELGGSGDDNEEELHQKLRKGEEEEKSEELEAEELTQDDVMQKSLAQANNAKMEGNKLFGQAKYDEALLQYEFALQTAPDTPSSVELRSICYANCGVCYMKQGKYEEAIKECTKALELNPTYLKALIRRAEAHEKLEHFEEAIVDMKKTLELDSSNEEAKKSIHRLEPLAEQKREKMKEEMIGKLKEMGSSLLGRFGMSLDNFKAVKDPNTGSYSISYQQ